MNEERDRLRRFGATAAVEQILSVFCCVREVFAYFLTDQKVG
ncbi:MAG: hypothetical protein Q7R60_02760 [bacterium]|nr:hypothetical protein [bacterium]